MDWPVVQHDEVPKGGNVGNIISLTQGSKPGHTKCCCKKLLPNFTLSRFGSRFAQISRNLNPIAYFLLLTLTLQLPSIFNEELSAAISKMAQC